MMTRVVSTIACVMLACTLLLFSGCGGEKGEPEFEISNLDYTIVHYGRLLYTVNVTGTIRNVGTADASNVTVTGGCPSCITMFRQAEWHLIEREKVDYQKAVIRLLGKGERANFEFQGLAYYSTGGGESPTELPDELAVYVMSFETAR